MTERENNFNRKDAIDLLTQALQIGDCINNMMVTLGNSGTSSDIAQFIESVGLITVHNADVIFRIRKIYPDLHPMFDEFK